MSVSRTVVSATKSVMSLILAALVATSGFVMAADKLPLGVACLLEDNGAELLPKLTNPWGDPGEGQFE